MIIGMFLIGLLLILIYRYTIAAKSPDIRKLLLYSYLTIYLVNAIKLGIINNSLMPIYEMSIFWITTSFISSLILVVGKRDRPNSALPDIHR
jgi:hypothetical protein